MSKEYRATWDMGGFKGPLLCSNRILLVENNIRRNRSHQTIKFTFHNGEKTKKLQ